LFPSCAGGDTQQQPESLVIQPFGFEADDRKFECSIEKARPGREAWWWFTVTGDSQRHAPFQVDAEDTRETVEARVLAYYRALLVQRAQPRDMRTSWQQRRDNLAALKR
jgi:hypothetical protein